MATMSTTTPSLRKWSSFPSSSKPFMHSHVVVVVQYMKPLHCTPIQQQLGLKVDGSIMCEACNGKGWLLCDFCKGQKTNVKAADSRRIYRRCPTCRAVGYVLCSRCKVYKCVTFPNFDDSEE